jgi:hypothetical protein
MANATTNRVLVEKEFTSANIIKVTLSHNGYGGGDAGHGGYVNIKITNLSGTDMSVNGEQCSAFELHIRGDAERDTFMKAFKMIAKELKRNK